MQKGIKAPRAARGKRGGATGGTAILTQPSGGMRLGTWEVGAGLRSGPYWVLGTLLSDRPKTSPQTIVSKQMQQGPVFLEGLLCAGLA